MAATVQAVKTNTITLKGSCQKVSEFFFYGINSLLYQRGIYSPETFTRKQKYGLTLFESTENALQDYLSNVLKQLNEWLNKKTVQKVVVVVTEVESGEVQERWQFDVECDKTVTHDSQPSKKMDEDINKEIRAVITQITATVTFLPLLAKPCTFNILIYTNKDMAMPEQWEESGPSLIANSQEVKLRSFTTSIHKVEAAVSYKDDGT